MPPPPWSYQTSRGIVGRLEKFSEILFSKSLSLISTSTSEGWTVHSKPPFSLIPFISLKSWFCILRLSLVAFRLVDFFSEKIIVGSQIRHLWPIWPSPNVLAQKVHLVVCGGVKMFFFYPLVTRVSMTICVLWCQSIFGVFSLFWYFWGQLDPI